MDDVAVEHPPMLGGIVLCERVETSEASGLPRAAMMTAMVDVVAPRGWHRNRSHPRATHRRASWRLGHGA